MIEVRAIESEKHRKLELVGDLDASSSLTFDNAIQKSIGEMVFLLAIDCNELNYISSAGLGVFISNMKTLQNNNGKFVLFGLKDTVLQVFRMLGLDQIIEICDTEKQAEKLLHA